MWNLYSSGGDYSAEVRSGQTVLHLAVIDYKEDVFAESHPLIYLTCI